MFLLPAGLAVGSLLLLRPLLYGSQAQQAAVFAGAAVFPLLAATLACWLPAQRAAKIDPVETLRAQ